MIESGPRCEASRVGGEEDIDGREAKEWGMTEDEVSHVQGEGAGDASETGGEGEKGVAVRGSQEAEVE